MFEQYLASELGEPLLVSGLLAGFDEELLVLLLGGGAFSLLTELIRA